MRRALTVAVIAAAATAACSSSIPVESIPPLDPITPQEATQLLETSERPIVLNVWASWCGPCRSEAPVLRRAHAEFGDVVDFIGIDVRDSQNDARSFIAEFGLGGFPHRFDATGAVPSHLGGFGVPLTFFIAPGGQITHLHSGVIDERTLVLWIDDLLAAAP